MNRCVFALLVVLACREAAAPPPVDDRPAIGATVSVRSIYHGCALDWSLGSADTTVLVSYEVGKSDGSGAFVFSGSPYYHTGTFRTSLQFTDERIDLFVDFEYVAASLWVPGHPGWGSIWGRPFRLRWAYGNTEFPSCWLE